VVGLVGRRIGGNGAGLTAALLAAAYPNLWMVDGILFPEGLFALTIGLTILAAYRLRDHPSSWRATLLGVTVALAALTRGEAILLVAFLTIPLILLMRELAWKRRFVLLLLACVGTGVVMAPWTIRNLTTFNEHRCSSRPTATRCSHSRTAMPRTTARSPASGT
jgi:4-amino-4-deoxy-L-arabinose transferase-like glycosyltransferase